MMFHFWTSQRHLCLDVNERIAFLQLRFSAPPSLKCSPPSLSYSSSLQLSSPALVKTALLGAVLPSLCLNGGGTYNNPGSILAHLYNHNHFSNHHHNHHHNYHHNHPSPTSTLAVSSAWPTYTDKEPHSASANLTWIALWSGWFAIYCWKLLKSCRLIWLIVKNKPTFIFFDFLPLNDRHWDRGAPLEEQLTAAAWIDIFMIPSQ